MGAQTSGLLHVAGCRYWTASLLPAVVGTTLPFWLRPPGFSFRWPAAVAFLQVGDLTRKVHVASAPLVAATALWVWTDELVTRPRDERDGRQTMVVLLGPRLSERVVVLALSLLLYATLVTAVLTRSLPPWALAALVTVGLVRAVVSLCWDERAGLTRLDTARRRAFAVHLVTGVIVAASSLA